MIGPSIDVAVGEAAKRFLPEIRYSLEEIGRRLCRRVRVVSETADPTLAYGTAVGEGLAPEIPFQPECYDRESIFRLSGSPATWRPAETSDGPPDLIGSVFRLLTMADENRVAEEARDRRGIFRVAALPSERRETVDVPMVERNVERIGELLGRPAGSAPESPRWPEGKRWALLLTHDTDALRLSSASEILVNATKGLIRGDPRHREMARKGLRGTRAPISTDPLFGFPTWHRTLDDLGVVSAFYLFVRLAVRRDLNDCRSTVADPSMDWGPLLRMADSGFEFGYHAPIGAKASIDEFLQGKRFLEEHLRRPVRGLRHHYWALDWRNPHLTYRKHVNAGFRYDLSIAWRDEPGFRAGTALPFRPWDPGRRKPLDIYCIPTAIMDGHLISSDTSMDVAFERGVEMLETIRDVGGVAVLDWHTESAWDRLAYEGHRTLAHRLLTWVIEERDAWVTTPWDLTTHWHTAQPSGVLD